MANTIAYNKHDYMVKMRERIAKPSSWMDVLNVKYRNTRTIVGSYMSTEPDTQTGTRGTAYGYSDFVVTADTLTISSYAVIPMLIDEADKYQQSYADQMELAAYQGKKINEKIETLTLAQHASWKDFGLTDVSNTGDDDTTAITVSASNIDDIIRAIKRKIYANNGVDFAVERGIFIVWRAQDFEVLEAFAQANGYMIADNALKSGIPVPKGFHYMGVDHYLSNSHTATHVFAGIKRTGELGILTGTFGKAKFIEDPGQISGVGIVSRLDHGFNWPAQLAEFFIDVNVA